MNDVRGWRGELKGHRKEETMLWPGKSVSSIIISSQCLSKLWRGTPYSFVGEQIFYFAMCVYPD